MVDSHNHPSLTGLLPQEQPCLSLLTAWGPAQGLCMGDAQDMFAEVLASWEGGPTGGKGGDKAGTLFSELQGA